MREIWKDIKNYEKLYQISNLGNVRRIDRKTIRMLKQYKNKNTNYKQVILSNENKQKLKLVHRLVAETFIENKENKRCVNHIDGNKENNKVDNLEWCTYSENTNHSYKNQLQKKLYGKDNKLSKKIIQYDLEGNMIKVWSALREVQRELGITNGNISSCCNGHSKTAGGYIWKYY